MKKIVKTVNIAANNHYSGFGPMTAKLFAEMMNLKNHVRPFPIVDYKMPFMDLIQTEKDKQTFRVYKQLSSKTR